MKLDEAINHLNDLIKENNFNCESCRKEHIQLKKWLSELKEFRKSKSDRSIKSYMVTFWCDTNKVTYGVNVLARNENDAIRKCNEMYPKMQLINVELTKD